MKKRCAVKIERFEELLDQYGWDLASWPDALRREANVLIAQDAQAAEMLKSLRSVEDLLSDDPLPLGKHKAIDDIFAAIEAQEAKSGDARDNSETDPAQSFATIDDRPRSRAHLSAASAAPTGESPARKTYPAKSATSPVNQAITGDGAHYGGRAKGTLYQLGRGVFSGVGMVVCVLAGFAFGVAMTVQEGHQVTAQADEIEMIDLLENHLYVIDQMTNPDDLQKPEMTKSDQAQGVQPQ